MPTGKQRHMTPEEEKLYHEGFVKSLQLNHVDECMQMLGISLNLIDPRGVFGSPAELMSQMQIMETVKDDYRKLSDAILALRKAMTAQELVQKILSLIEEAYARAEVRDEAYRVGCNALALGNIENVCKEQ